MKRKTLVKIHLTATIVATLTIVTFLISSVIAEINGEEVLIKKVKEFIFYSLPILLVVMPVLGITGNKLAGKSKSPLVLNKQRRMKFILMNGLVLIILASFLFYRSHFQDIDSIFFGFQFIEFAIGLTNLTFISLNIKSGLQLSGKLQRSKLYN